MMSAIWTYDFVKGLKVIKDLQITLYKDKEYIAKRTTDPVIKFVVKFDNGDEWFIIEPTKRMKGFYEINYIDKNLPDFVVEDFIYPTAHRRFSTCVYF